MPTSGEPDDGDARLLLDTSAAIALVQPSHTKHEAVFRRVRGVRLGLAGHAAVETYSVLTRLPGAQRVSGPEAARIIRTNFPLTYALAAATAADAPDLLARRGIAGGAAYDGLVALAAAEAGLTLLTCDRRAVGTYAQFGVDLEIV
ncbi:type II toxin-antitoxin system VapC family toxin [Microbacterium album]|uniref:Ribonuclease VapC n=1 Tax=Microbacterium album TaxID=2053191 RepID=A0A917MMT5_9MICO|nr:type II toxin-antitoxin system VapC family toxin [Microbacterium album]GGH49492.1 ribonuclease VapC [Microbacterium album]